jgi:hypothetical protein
MSKIITDRGIEIEVTEAQEAEIAHRMNLDKDAKILGPMLAGDGCILLQWCGMVLGIEKDGYAHS